MKSMAHSSAARSLDSFEDIPTAVLDTLGTLVRSAAVVVTRYTPLAEVRKLLVQRRVPAVVVVDGTAPPFGGADATLCGIVTRTDVLRAIDDDATAGDAMSGFVFVLPARSAIEKAAALMAYEGVGQVVVTGSGGELIGMVSAIDVARYFAVEAGYLVE
jgi:CBS domain-containing protein